MTVPPHPRRQNLSIVAAVRLLAWLLLIGLIVATLSPIRLRPSDVAGVEWDRGLAYAITGLCFTVSYPGRGKRVVLWLLAAAIALELMQFLSATRHPGLVDVSAKSIGAFAGSVAGNAALKMMGYWGRRRKRAVAQ